MRTRSHLLYGAGGLLVLVVCLAFGLTMITGVGREASFARLKEQIASVEARTLPLRPATLQTDVPSDMPSVTREETIEAFAEAMVQCSAWEKDKTGQASSLLSLLGEKPVSSWTDDEWSQVRDFLAAHQELLAKLRRIATAGGPLVDIASPVDFATPRPHLTTVRTMARLLMLDALERGNAGDTGSVIADVNACLGLAQGVEKEHIIYSSLVATAMRRIARQSMENAIPPGSLSEEELRQIQVMIPPGEKLRLGFTRALAGESLAGMATFSQPGSSFNSILQPLMDFDQRAYADAMADMLRAAQLPYWEGRGIAEELEADLRKELSLLHPMTRCIVPSLTRSLKSTAQAEVDMDLTRLGLAVETYHTQTGDYPATLDDVSHYLGGEVPLDAFTGRSYVYRVEDGEFTLYSAGSNQEDDGGQDSGNGDDCVWRGRKAD